jgi:rSAM/selenodomain-associated transferase 2
MNDLSIIIPVCNEEEYLGSLIDYLRANAVDITLDIIVVDGGSKDKTCQISQVKEVNLIHSPKMSRAYQMNIGVDQAKSEKLYFLHADTIPPKGYAKQVVEAIDSGKKAGCFRFVFDQKKMLLQINAYFTRFDYMWCRGGDQSLFITKRFFELMNRFDEEYSIMEEYDLIRRINKRDKFHILPDYMTVSSRKYRTNSWLRVMLANMMAFRRFNKGLEANVIKEKYKSALNPY